MRDRKVCAKCKVKKIATDFYIYHCRGRESLRSRCKVCSREDRALYCARNKDKRSEYSKRYAPTAAIRARELYHRSEQARLARLLRSRLQGIVQVNGERKAKAKTLLGCSADEYRTYIENLFTGGMSWDGVRSGIIHIDHIVPCSFFDLTKEDAQRACFHYSNTRPVWKEDNLKKSKRIFVQDLHRLERVKHLINMKRISIITA